MNPENQNIHIAYCPERVLPGAIIKELITNDRVIGGITKKASGICHKFYSSFCKGNLLITDDKTAEMVKLTENSFRDLNIAFANELSMICEKLGINDNELIELANKHPRVNILKPGCGVGGHCIAVDPWFIVGENPNLSELIKTSRLVNKSKTLWVIEKIKSELKIIEKKYLREATVGIFGITFKPNVEDLRESPAMEIYESLKKEGIKMYVCEPNLKNHNSIKIYSKESVTKKADLLVFLVAHKKFKNIKFENFEILDFCGISK